MQSMRGINAYWQESADPRGFVGGMWDELGVAQLDFMIEAGLKPDHLLLDVGCGCLRGGVHFIRYLDGGNYFGTDINGPLITAAWREVEAAGLEAKNPHLTVDASFALFESTFDYVLAWSLLTHLTYNLIGRCLKAVAEVLKPGGVFYATYFDAPEPLHLADIERGPGINTHMDSDPYHYSLMEMRAIAGYAGLNVVQMPGFSHPRGQSMLRFSHA